MQMKPNSVIVDIGMDHGGCFETSEVTTLEAPTLRSLMLYTIVCQIFHQGFQELPRML